MMRIHTSLIWLWVALAARAAAALADDDAKLAVLEVKDYGVAIEYPVAWKLIGKGEEAFVFGLSIPNDDPRRAGGVKCEIAPAPESLDEYRKRIDGRAKRERERNPSLALSVNEVKEVAGREQLVSQWDFELREGGVVHDLELRVIAHEQLYIFTLRAADPVFADLRAPFEKLVAEAKFTPPNTGLELTKDGLCVQKKFRFGLKLPDGWRPSFPLSQESLFWANAKPTGIWNDNLLVVATKTAPLDIEALVEKVPDQLRREDPNCTVRACERVRQGKLGDALETVVETQRGTFKIVVLERRWAGRRYNYEIKFTVTAESFGEHVDALRKSADSFIEFVAPQDLKGDAT